MKRNLLLILLNLIIICSVYALGKASAMDVKAVKVMSEGKSSVTNSVNFKKETYVPVSSIDKVLDKKVEVDKKNKTIEITDRKEQFSNSSKSLTDDMDISPQKVVAHAGGSVKGIIYSNSLEAFNKSYRNGIRFFEADLDWTSDNYLVLIHDWGNTFNLLFNATPKRTTLKDFLKLNMKENLTQQKFKDFANWLKGHPFSFLITDVKEDNLKALTAISQYYPDIINRIIPQIYTFDEYAKVKKLGFNRIILTLYRSNYPDNKIIEFNKTNPLFAVTMEEKRAQTASPSILGTVNLFVYAHTIDSTSERDKLYENGVDGIYSNELN